MGVIYHAPTQYGEPAANVCSDFVQQHFNNSCAVKCQQLILERFGIHVSEEELCRIAEANGWFQHDDPTTPQIEGGTSMGDVGNLLEHFGIPVNRYVECNVFNMVAELAQGHQIIVGVDANELWNNSRLLEVIKDMTVGESPNHALILSGLDATDPNNIKVTITDPGTGELCKEYPLEQFVDAHRDSNCFMVATSIPAPHVFDAFADDTLAHLPSIGSLPYGEFVDLCFTQPIPDFGTPGFDDFCNGFLNTAFQDDMTIAGEDAGNIPLGASSDDFQPCDEESGNV